jgi:hypothetical protein
MLYYDLKGAVSPKFVDLGIIDYRQGDLIFPALKHLLRLPVAKPLPDIG